MTVALTVSRTSSSSAARALARRTLAKGSKSFALAGRLLPTVARDDAAALYAWCRRADDAVDLVAPEAAPAAVQQLRRELTDVYAGHVQSDPVLAGFQSVVKRCKIPIVYPNELVDGFAMDAAGARYEDRRELGVYCYRVAGVVGLMMCHVLGVADEGALVHATHLGMAMQLTNICRDVAEDWSRGRLYVPRELLDPHWPEQVAAGTSPPAALRAPLASAVQTLLSEAQTLYASGARGFGALPWRASVAIRTASLVYSDIGRVLGSREHDVLAPRAVVAGGRKLALVARAVAAACRELPARARGRRFDRPRRVFRFDEVWS